MGGILFFSLFGLACLALLRWLVNSCRVHWKTWHFEPNLVQTILLVISGVLHLIAIAAWLLMALTTLGAVTHQLSPGGPAPYFLMPWFTGLFILGVANFFAESLDALVRRDYAHLIHGAAENKPGDD